MERFELFREKEYDRIVEFQTRTHVRPTWSKVVWYYVLGNTFQQGRSGNSSLDGKHFSNGIAL